MHENEGAISKRPLDVAVCVHCITKYTNWQVIFKLLACRKFLGV